MHTITIVFFKTRNTDVYGIPVTRPHGRNFGTKKLINKTVGQYHESKMRNSSLIKLKGYTVGRYHGSKHNSELINEDTDARYHVSRKHNFGIIIAALDLINRK